MGDLDGLKDHPFEDTGAKKTSEAPVGASEERGRSPRNNQQNLKKVFKTLEHRGQGPNKVTKGLHNETRSRRRSKLEDSQPRKGFLDLRKWFERQGPAQEKEQERQDQKKEPEEENL